jgi:hypothetical protein
MRVLDLRTQVRGLIIENQIENEFMNQVRRFEEEESESFRANHVDLSQDEPRDDLSGFDGETVLV